MKWLTFFVLITFQCIAQSSEIDVWEDDIPYYVSNIHYQEKNDINKDGTIIRVRNVTKPTLTIFDNVKSDRAPAVIICPGGGYQHLSIDKEGFKVAKWFNSIGVKAFVLKYRLPSDKISNLPELVPLSDVEESLRLINTNSDKFGIDSTKIGLMGFSAGGHLAASGAKFADFSILIYPVISMNSSITHKGSRSNLIGQNPSKELIQRFSVELNVGKETPPTFLVHAQDDQSVSIQNSLRYYSALCDHHIDSEFHSYQTGGHGFGMGRNITYHPWVGALEKWLVDHVLP